MTARKKILKGCDLIRKFPTLLKAFPWERNGHRRGRQWGQMPCTFELVWQLMMHRPGDDDGDLSVQGGASWQCGILSFLLEKIPDPWDGGLAVLPKPKAPDGYCCKQSVSLCVSLGMPLTCSKPQFTCLWKKRLGPACGGHWLFVMILTTLDRKLYFIISYSLFHLYDCVHSWLFPSQH